MPRVAILGKGIRVNERLTIPEMPFKCGQTALPAWKYQHRSAVSPSLRPQRIAVLSARGRRTFLLFIIGLGAAGYVPSGLSPFLISFELSSDKVAKPESCHLATEAKAFALWWRLSKRLNKWARSDGQLFERCRAVCSRSLRWIRILLGISKRKSLMTWLEVATWQLRLLAPYVARAWSGVRL